MLHNRGCQLLQNLWHSLSENRLHIFGSAQEFNLDAHTTAFTEQRLAALVGSMLPGPEGSYVFARVQAPEAHAHNEAQSALSAKVVSSDVIGRSAETGLS